MRLAVRILSLDTIAVVAVAQAPLSFEVASVRAANKEPPYKPMPAIGVITGGPGTSDPERIRYTWVPLFRLVLEAFKVGTDQLSGKDFGDLSDRFNVIANVPPGATKEQANEMLLNLLTGRFHLKYHREKRDFDSYALVVAKGGPKLKDAEIPDGRPPEGPKPGTRPQVVLDREGFPQLPAGRPYAQGKTQNGVERLTFRMATPQLLFSMLQIPMGGARLVDKTGLAGQYDFTLEFSHAGLPGPLGRVPGPDVVTDPAPDLFTALEKQLGLKLEKSKVPLDVIVIDHMDKEPTEN